MFERIRAELQCLDGLGKYFHLRKIPSEFQGLEGKEKNCNVSNDKARIPMFGWIRSEVQCLEQ